jgi:MerR family transcriptional regulator, repressor of the yfmOP operon
MGATDTTAGLLRIGEVARLVDTTPRTIRYYEEIGLLAESPERDRGRHRLYTEADVERLRELLRLRDLLGVSLEELKELVEVEAARAALREEWRHGGELERPHEILAAGIGHLDRQLALVRGRRAQLERLEEELSARRRRVRDRLHRLERETPSG